MMKRRWIWIGLLIAGLVCAVVGGVLWWRQQHPQPYCSVSQDGDRTTEYTMCTDKQKYQFGEPIHVTFTIKNISGGTGLQKYSSMEYGNGIDPAIDICDQAGHICWSDEQMLTEDDKHFILKLHESRTLTWTWPTTPEHLDYIKDLQSTLSPFVCQHMSLYGYETWPPQSKPEIVFGIGIIYSCRR